MSYLKLFCLLLLVGTASLSTAQQNKIDLEISTQCDTITVGQPIPIRILITNISNKQIQLTQNFTIVSNMFPNPFEQINQGARLVFNIEPNPMGGETWIEDQVFIWELIPRTLEPNESVELEYNLNNHLNNFISLQEPSPLTGEYLINLTYEFRKRKGTRGFITGTILSNELTLIVKE